MKLKTRTIFDIATTLLIILVAVIGYLKYSDARANNEMILPLDSSSSSANLKQTQQITPINIISDLVKKSSKSLNQPGWVHVEETTTYDIDQQNNGILPDGTVIPLSYITDAWFHINKDGLVDQSASIMKSMDEEAIQISTFTNSVQRNSSSQYSPQGQNPYFLGPLDYNFAATVQEITLRKGSQPEFINANDSTRSGISTFAITDKLAAPLLTVDYEKPVVSYTTIASYDNSTGFLVEIKVIAKFEDGSERTFYNTTSKIENGVSAPPNDILMLIEERK